MPVQEIPVKDKAVAKITVHLCLHCGTNPKKGYTNYDNRFEFASQKEVNPSIDNYMFEEYEPESVDEILANLGCLESLRREQLVATVKRWHEMLAKGGIVRIDTFDIYLVTNDFLHDRIDLLQFEAISEKMKSFHCPQTVKELMESVGFKLQLGTYLGQFSSLTFEKL